MPNPVMHFQLSSKQPEATAQFYRDLFAWKLNEIPGMGYTMIETEPKQGIVGGVGHAKESDAIEVSFYVQVPDVQAALDKAQSLGATITQVPLVVTPELTLGMFKDLEGRSIGVMHDSQVQAELDAPPVKLKAAAAKPKAKAATKKKAAPKPKKKVKKKKR
jgi:predicted enzyme related to lactoylglutathione lyase